MWLSRLFGADQDPDGLKWFRKKILNAACPLCHQAIDGQHSVARIGGYNVGSTGAGFLDWVEERRWDEIVTSIVLTSTAQDTVWCEVIRCSRGLVVVAWVEYEAMMMLPPRLGATKEIGPSELARIETLRELDWAPFPD